MEMNRKTNDIIYIRLFQICIIVSSVFGEEATYYRLANFTVLIFFLSVLVMIANKGVNDPRLRGEYRGMSVSLTFLGALCMWLMWVCVYMNQKNPLIKPSLSEDSPVIS